MKKPEDQPAETAPEPEKKHNLGAKFGVAFALGGVIGGKLAIPGLVMDLNNMFPKGTPLGTKFKQTFSKEIIPLLEKSMLQEMKKGRSPLMAALIATKWSMILPTVGGIGLGILGWKRADRIQDSKDIVKHPIKSTKIILGLEDPDPAPSKGSKGKHTAALAAERATPPEAQTER